MTYKVKDHFFKKAKKEDFRARSVYKLQEINEKNKVIKSGDFVLDLGSYPGSWVQYISKIIGSKGRVVGVDIQEIKEKFSSNFTFLHKSIFEITREEFNIRFDVITSDMAPSTTGIKDVDQEASLQLCFAAFGLCRYLLKDGGNFICKIFQGSSTQNFIKELKKSFKDVILVKPKSTRKESFEIFIICKKIVSSR